MITQEELKSKLQYNPDTGVFIWLTSNSRRMKIGDISGYVNKRGYVKIRLEGKDYLAHRLAWLYVYGSLPYTLLDHKDGDPSNNRISNLRECTQSENMKNRYINKNNVSGFKGVCWVKRENKWLASAALNGKSYHIGYYMTPEEAASAYYEFAIKHHGEFFREIINVEESTNVTI